MALSAGAAAGWDLLAAPKTSEDDWASLSPSRGAACAVALAIGVVAYVAAGLCLYFPNFAARSFYNLARALPVPDTFPKTPPPDPVDAAAFMLHALPHAATAVLLIALAAAALVWLGSSRRLEARYARYALFAFVVCDLVVRAWAINPAIDPSYVAEPQWLSYTRADPDARFYIGGKRLGSLDTEDPDGSRAFVRRNGLNGAESRAALNAQALFYPSPYHAREMLSHDLPVLWPREFALAAEMFSNAKRDARDRFLERTGVRYRVVADRAAEGHTPILKVPYFYESYLFDWGAAAPRVSVVAGAVVEADVRKQVSRLFEGGWDSSATVIVDRDVAAAGTPGAALAPAAHIASARSDRLAVDANAGAGGGYLVVLDSYSTDWRVRVDGSPADLLRADGLFRAVRLAPGHHIVDFRYAPPSLVQGAAASGVALIAVIGLCAWPAKRKLVPGVAARM
jgi:hypothetical protein